MQKILKVAQREYIETVKTKVFLIGVLMAPVIIAGIIFFTNLISRGEGGPRPPIKVGVTDLSNKLLAEIETSFDEYNDSHSKRQILLQELETQENSDPVEKQGKNKLRSAKLDVYVVLDKDILEGSGKIHLYTHKPKPSNLDALWTIENLFKEAIINRRYELQELDPQLLAELRHVPTEQVEISSSDDEGYVQSKGQRMARMMVPFFFMYLIFMGIVGTGQQMLSSIIEEKSSRVIEVLLSAVSPFQLMAGKILGLAGIGLTVISLWAVAAYAAARWQGLNVEVTAELMIYFAIYYILGFLLFSSILAGVGSICNTIKETQGLMMPIMLVFIIPLLAWFKLVQSPDGMLARVLSFLPPLTPMVMILRLFAGSDIWIVEIFASVGLLAAAVLATIWLAAKVFRTGILMYGKRPGLREVLRWMRQS
ncbi:MAG: ABC transporter permease [Phycisphaerae bacterium]